MLTALLYVRSSQMWPQRPTCVIATSRRVATRRCSIGWRPSHLASRCRLSMCSCPSPCVTTRGRLDAGLPWPTDARSEEAGGGWRVVVRMPCPPACPPRAMCALESGRDREPRLDGGPRATRTGSVSSADYGVNLAGLYSTFRHCQCQFHLARHHESVLRVQAGC